MTETNPSLVETIAAKSRADAKAVILTAERVSERNIELAKKHARAREDAAAAELEAQAASMKSQERAEAAAQAARIKADARRDLVEKVMAEALSRLATAPRDDSYAAVLERLVREAAAALGTKEAIVTVSARDREFMSQQGRFERIAGSVRQSMGATLTLSNDTADISGGAIVATHDGKLSYYNTFDEAAYRGRSALKSLIAQELFG